MPGEKTEKPTPKKRRDARKEGNVFKSTDVNNSVGILTSLLLLSVLGPSMIRRFQELYIYFFTDGISSYTVLDGNSLNTLLLVSGQLFFLICGPMILILLVTGMTANFAQVGFLFVPKVLAPKLDRINPINGLKQMFSMKTFKNFLKSLLKVFIIVLLSYGSIIDLVTKTSNTINQPMLAALAEGAEDMRNLAVKLLIAMVAVSALDYFFSWQEHEKKLKMDKQEVTDEYKNTDGNPEIKSKIKGLQRQMANARMMQSIPTADVIIVNPTHFSVAIAYDKTKARAPIVVAKGQDLIALRIREIAKTNQVEIVENKELARNLYDSVSIGQEIPEHLFKAVAEILAYIYSLKKRKS
jgi:flagellar biosynthetic protein FlhB